MRSVILICLLKLKITGSHVHCKGDGTISEMVQDRCYYRSVIGSDIRTME